VKLDAYWASYHSPRERAEERLRIMRRGEAVMVSEAIIGTETPWYESLASQATADWSAFVSKASMQVYGTPTPAPESLYSHAGDLAAQATAAAAAQFAAVQALFSELVSGKEPTFTESAMSRLSSAYHTAMPSFASVASKAFTPPTATLEAILASASAQVYSAVEAASARMLSPEVYRLTRSFASDCRSLPTIRRPFSVLVAVPVAAMLNPHVPDCAVRYGPTY